MMHWGGLMERKDMIRGFCYNEKDQDVFYREFDHRLPDRIIDGHVHSWKRECLNIEKVEYEIYKKYKPWTDFDLMEQLTIEEFNECAGKLFPERKYQGMFFGLPFPQVDRKRSNEYILENAGKYKAGFYYMPGQYEDAREAQECWKLLERPGFLGFKPYPDLAHVEEGEVGIYDMLNASFLEFAEENGLNIMLHIPGKERLRSEKTRRELEDITSRYQNIRFLMAHAGRSFCFFDIEGSIDFLVDKPNVWFDTALLNDPPVLEYLFRKVPSDRIVFGSDAPLAFTRGKDICVNHKHYYVAGDMVPWGLSAMTEGLLDLTFYIYEEIRAILYASKAVYGSGEREHLNRIFYGNSRRMQIERGL